MASASFSLALRRATNWCSNLDAVSCFFPVHRLQPYRWFYMEVFRASFVVAGVFVAAFFFPFFPFIFTAIFGAGSPCCDDPGFFGLSFGQRPGGGFFGSSHGRFFCYSGFGTDLCRVSGESSSVLAPVGSDVLTGSPNV
jgi:hypothetical protein